MLKLIITCLISLACSVAIASPPTSLSTPLDDNYSNGCNDPGQYAVTDSEGNAACYGKNGQPA